MMEDVVAPVLHNNVPDAVVDKVDVPLQLLATFTIGVDGVVFGAAVPEPASLIQPLTVWVTVYVPALLTMMEAVVAPVLHNNVPDAVVDKVDVPLQLLTTFTIGVSGVVFGAAVPEPASLTQPSTVWVTVYAPALLTMMEAVVDPVLHNNIPDAVVDKVDVPLQLLTTFTDSVDGVGLIVKFNVTTLSHPAAFMKVRVAVADAVYVTPYQTKLPQDEAVVSPVFGEQTPALISFKETPLTELLDTKLLVTFELLLLSNDQDEPLFISNFKPLAVSPFN